VQDRLQKTRLEMAREDLKTTQDERDFLYEQVKQAHHALHYSEYEKAIKILYEAMMKAKAR
jgi:hypothetical protein